MKNRLYRCLVIVSLFLFASSFFLAIDNRVVHAQSSITIQAWDSGHGWLNNVPITMDGNPTGFNTPHTFTVSGTHSFTVPITDSYGTRFSTWDSGPEPLRLTIWRSEGTYTAQYNSTPYDVTIKACDPQGWASVPITMDDNPTGYNTPHTFTGLKGLHVFNVPNTEGLASYSFDTWSGYEYGRVSLSVCSAGTYTGQYGGALPPYSATIWAWDNVHGWLSNLSISMNGAPTGYLTPHTFTNLIGSRSFSVPDTNYYGTSFKNWSTGETTTIITVNSDGTYTAQYYHYDVTIWAWDSANGWLSNMRIAMDYSFTDFYTPHTFTGLSGTHSFGVSITDNFGNLFGNWSTGWTGSTITVNSEGTYTARYYPYSVTIWGWDNIHGWLNNLPITKDGAPTGFNTPHTFTLSGIHSFTVPTTNSHGTSFRNWSSGETSTTITVNPEDGGTYTAQYYHYNATIWAWDNVHGWLNETITMDGDLTAYNTPHMFTGLSGVHTFTVPSVNKEGTLFKNWTTGETSPTITVTSDGTYTAQYYHYNVTIWAWDSGNGWLTNVPITMDGVPTGYTTPHTFVALGGVHSFTVPSTDSFGTAFGNWTSGETTTIMAVASGGTWTAQYYKSPTGSISINGGANFTASTSVTLSVTYTAYVSSVSQVRYSNDGVSWTAWEAPAPSRAWSLASGDGMKTVYYQVKDSGGLVSSTYSDSIMLDTAAPAGSIQINGGAAYTNVTTANLTLLATDVGGSGVSEMRFSDNGASFTAWEPYSTSKSWTLVGGLGTKYVHVQFKDRVDLTVAAYDTIVLDTMLPVANAGQNQNAQIGQAITLSGSGSTDNIGIASYQWNFGDGTTGTGETTNHTYSNVGTYTVSLMVKDLAGNSAASSSTVSVEVAIPELPPTVMLLLFVMFALALAFGFRWKLARKPAAQRTWSQP